MSEYDLNHAPWRRSTRSNGNGGNNCVEVTPVWRRSTRSNGNGGNDCLEIAVVGPVAQGPYRPS